MRNIPRRLFLRSALTAGGLLLPWGGKHALAVSDPDAAAALPVCEEPLPISDKGQAMRQLRRQLAEVHARPHSQARSAEWFHLMLAYTEGATALADRPVRSWIDCVELAEVAWHLSPKAQRASDGEWLPHLRAGVHGTTVGFFHAAPSAERASAALVEAVMTLGAGERLDPRTGTRSGRG